MKNEKDTTKERPKAANQTPKAKANAQGQANAKPKKPQGREKKTTQLDKYGFKKGSNRSKFAALIEKEPMTLNEARKKVDCKMSFTKTFKILEAKGIATKNADGKVYIVKK